MMLHSRIGIPTCVFLLSFCALPELLAEPGESTATVGPPVAQTNAQAQPAPDRTLELSRAVRPWEFLSAVGTRAALFGREDGRLEAWVYPLKILRDFSLTFHVGGRALPAASLARTVTVRPESCSILYAGDSFVVRETLFVPVDEPGAVIILEIETAEPLEIEAGFERDFQLMWPAALGGTYMGWDTKLRAFALGEEQRRFFALIGSPSAAEPRQEYSTNSNTSRKTSFRLGRTEKGKQQKVIVLAASVESRAEAEKTYRRLSNDFPRLQQEAADHYRRYLERTVALQLPDRELQQAYDWSRVSVLQGMVNNPFLGSGLIAGYRTSGSNARPGFAWFFGRDALWTALALNAAGDFANVRTALDFLIQYQRDDGKIPHEVAQGANFVPWFEDYPYGYASADATPLFILAMKDYAVRSGDLAFVQDRWASLWKAHAFLQSTRGPQGFAQNEGVGHGWVEGGPLLPVRTEFYQSGLGVAALGALAQLARLTGKEEIQNELEQGFARQKALLNDAFWVPEKNIFAFALDQENKKVEVASVLATVPLWFDLLAAEKANAMINRLADADHAADWGMRIISSQDARFGPTGYHFGSVWPLFTGWASVGEYRAHRAFPAYANLRANALLALDRSLGHVTEVLSGSYYSELSTSSPHQIWSAAMVISPLLRGLFGLESDATANRVTLAPHVPASWDWFEIQNLPVGSATLSLAYRKSRDEITLAIERRGSGDAVLEFAPAVSLRAKVLGVEMNGRPVAFRLQTSAVDQHVVVHFPVPGGPNTLRIRLQDDFALHVSANLPPLGGSSRNLKVVSRTWNTSRDRLEVEVAGLAGSEYEISLWGAEQIAGVEGAELVASGQGKGHLRVTFPATADGAYVRRKILIRFNTGR